MAMIGFAVLTISILGQPAAWISKNIRPSTKEEQRVRSEVEAMLKPGWFLPNGSFRSAIEKSYIALTNNPKNDLLLLKLTLLHVHGAYDIGYKNSGNLLRFTESMLRDTWATKKDVPSFEMQRAAALFFRQAGQYFVKTDLFERLDNYKTDPFLQAERLIEDCWFQSDDPKLVYAAKVRDGLLKVPYCRAKFVSTVVIYHSTAGAKARDKKHIAIAVQLLRTQANSIPLGHPTYDPVRIRERADGLEKLAASWGK